MLLHSFAHALIRELALECGYTASSIRERIYAATGADGEPMAGVLLYTAAPDSEGTLGGLVALGEPEQLGPLLRQALERAQLCSSDPLCAEHDPRADGSRPRRRLPRLPVRVRDVMRARQPVPRPRHDRHTTLARDDVSLLRHADERRALRSAACSTRLSDAQVEALAAAVRRSRTDRHASLAHVGRRRRARRARRGRGARDGLGVRRRA